MIKISRANAFPMPTLFLLIALLATTSICKGDNLSEDQMTDEVQTVQVGDINMAYRIMGRSEPLIMIMGGFGATMDVWSPQLLEDLSSRYRVIILDNRGMENTTAPAGNFPVAQFANDTAGLMDALHIKKANIFGWSMGGLMAQELAICPPEKVDKLILCTSRCSGGRIGTPQSKVYRIIINTSITNTSMINTLAINRSSSIEKQRNALPNTLFPPEWLSKQPPSYEWFPTPRETSPPENVRRQQHAIATWPGACDPLDKINSSTLVAAGTEDTVIPPKNAFTLAQGIDSSWLVQFKGGGHGLMYQYPDRLAGIIEDFIDRS